MTPRAGTTSRLLAAIAQGSLLAVIVVGVLGLWWPSWISWGALSGGLLATLSVWLAWRIVAGDRSVPGHLFYLALAGPSIILLYHFACTGLGRTPSTATLGGTLNASFLYEAGLLALAVLLVQSLLGGKAVHAATAAIGGAAMMAGGLAAIACGRSADIRPAMGFVTLAGTGVFLASAWLRDPPAEKGPFKYRVGGAAWAFRVFALVVALAVAIVTLYCSCRDVPDATAKYPWGCPQVAHPQVAPGGGANQSATILTAFGSGENAFGPYIARESCFAILLQMVGWVGTAWLLCLLAACLLSCLYKARGHGLGALVRALAWAWAAVMVTLALGAEGGLFMPAVVLSAALVWGLAPSICSVAPTRVSGWFLAVPAVALMILLGVAHEVGLALWAVEAFGLNDKSLHFVTGFLVALFFCWQLGGQNVRKGLLWLLVAVTLGGAGELLQMVASTRGGDWHDAMWHAFGSLLAVPIYLAAMGTRHTENSSALRESAG